MLRQPQETQTLYAELAERLSAFEAAPIEQPEADVPRSPPPRELRRWSIGELVRAAAFDPKAEFVEAPLYPGA